MSNDDICDALIKKAMEGIKAIPLASSIDKAESSLETKRITRSKESLVKNDVSEPNEGDEVTLRQVKNSLEKNDTKSLLKVTRSSKQGLIDAEKLEITVKVETEAKKSKKSNAVQSTKLESTTHDDKEVPTQNSMSSLNSLSFDYDEPKAVIQTHSEEEKEHKPEKPFNIMDYISTIKVNGVGVLFQCKLCNRNFLKLDVVESHSCAKNGVPKFDLPKSVPVPEPPKVPSVKYIKIDNDMKKTLTEKVKLAEKHENDKNGSFEKNIEPEKTVTPPIAKPKAGPASKTKRKTDLEPSVSQNLASQSSTNSSPEVSTVPSVHIPSIPNLNSRFKLVPGPNNMFSLVEDTSASLPANPTVSLPQDVKKTNKKRRSDTVNDTNDKFRDQTQEKSESPEIIDLEDPAKPYPVGLFQTVAHSQPTPTFTTPAMKKQSYTVVQTGDPSKLLISTKSKDVEVELPKKRQRKAKHESKDDPSSKEPFNVTLEDVAHPKDTGFFTFINVDPLLQPSYVLPTDNIIQESQISTSSAVLREPAESKEKERYSCNMCDEKFTREKKLLSHIQSHYSKMDEEDQIRLEKTTKKKSRK